MTVNVRIAIASHLSDAQEYLELGFRKNASSEINLAKAILFKYVSTDMEVEERELNELAHEVFMKFSTVKDKYRHEIRKITGTVQGVLGYSGGRG